MRTPLPHRPTFNAAVLSLPALAVMLVGCGDQTQAGADVEPAAPTANVHGDLLDLLPGSWLHEDPGMGSLFEEHWSRSPSGHLEGIGVVRRGNDTVMIEHLRIQMTDSGTWYSARIPSQNAGEPVHFRLVHDRDSLVFSQPEHDYPQYITYIPGYDEGWHVHLRGVGNGRYKEEFLHFAPSPSALITEP